MIPRSNMHPLSGAAAKELSRSGYVVWCNGNRLQDGSCTEATACPHVHICDWDTLGQLRLLYDQATAGAAGGAPAAEAPPVEDSAARAAGAPAAAAEEQEEEEEEAQDEKEEEEDEEGGEEEAEDNDAASSASAPSSAAGEPGERPRAAAVGAAAAGSHGLPGYVEFVYDREGTLPGGLVKTPAAHSGGNVTFRYMQERVSGSGGLPLCRQDRVLVFPDPRPKGAGYKYRRAASVAVTRMVLPSRPPRTVDQLLDGLAALATEGESEEERQDCRQRLLRASLGLSPALWEMLAQFAEENGTYRRRIVRLALQLANADARLRGDGAAVVAVLAAGWFDLGSASQDAFFQLAADGCPHFAEFCEHAVSARGALLHRLAQPLVAAAKQSPAEVAPQQSLLLSALALREARRAGCDMDWRTMSLTPTLRELGRGQTTAEDLPAVRVRGAYPSPAAYYDCYTRLLRADCFEALLTGIAQLQRGCLDPRDLRVYDASVVGIYVDKAFSIAVRVRPRHGSLRELTAAGGLMFGSLLCLTLDGDRFRNVLWATVSDFIGPQSDGLMLVELDPGCAVAADSHEVDPARAFVAAVAALLRCGTVTVAESPTYYRAHRPVLEVLQRANPTDLPFAHELVRCSRDPIGPGYLRDCTIDVAAAFRFKDGRSSRVTVPEAVQWLELWAREDSAARRRMRSTLDSDQARALAHALTHRVAVVQGGPGCGKTFVGIILVRMLDSRRPVDDRPGGAAVWDLDAGDADSAGYGSGVEEPGSGEASPGSPAADSSTPPIVVLTYKNHALEELLADCIANLPEGSVARVGGAPGRNKEHPRLRNCYMLRRDAEYFRGMGQDWHDNQRRLDSLRDRVREAVRQYDDARVLTPEVLWASASPKQLESLVRGARWGRAAGRGRGPAAAGRGAAGRSATGGGAGGSAGGGAAGGAPAAADGAAEAPTDPPAPALPLSKDAAAALLARVAEQGQKSGRGLGEQMRADLPPSRAATRDRLIATVTAAMDQWVPERDVFEGLTKEGGDLQRLLQDLQQAGAENDAPDAAREGDVDDEIAGEDERERLAAVLRDDSDPAEDARKKRNLVRVGEETDAAWRPRFVAALHARLQPAHERALQQCDDLWQLSPERRIFLAQVWLGRRLAAAEDRLCVLMQELSDTAAERAKLEQARDIELLRSKRVVGMTITGASIHAGLLRGLKPTTVLVEEAAEVIETQLLAVLGPWVEHLIMIGDHEQLPPPVASYRLRQSHHFAVSMLERVINNRLHYATLMRQSRQRPELSRLLCDRYPDMQDNLKIVGKLTPLESMHQSLFWWTHEHPEQKGRSPSNHEEAAMVQALVMYLVAQGTRPRDITVLTPYVGQMRLLRRTVRDRVQQYWETAKGEKHNGQLAVESVDRFQGDQNEVIIVSLVRSNPRRLSGFLEGDGGINRRVVLQSRARRALFLIGNLETLRYNTVKGDRVESTVWGPLVEAMGERIHHSIPLQCPRHPLNDQGEPLILEARSAADIPRAGQSVCKRPCGMLKDCLKHHCKRECHGETLEWHDAEKCTEKVKFRCVMGHQCERSCNEPESAVRCTEIVKFTCPKGHSQIRACWLPEEDVPCLLEVQCKCARGHHLLKKECVATVPECTEPCKVVLNCGHLCDKRCGERCPATVDECAACGREYEARMQRQREVAQQQREEEARRLAERLERLRAEGEPVKELEECGEDQLKQLQRTVVPLAQAAGTFLRLEGAESVRDSAAEIRFVKAQQSLGTLGVTVEWLVQLESDAAVVAAADEGFKTSKRDGWGHCLALRAGATRDGKALLCRVACGSCRTVSCSELDELGPDPGRMRKEWKCDSVKLVGDSGGDLLIVFKPRLVLVTHVLRVARAPAPDLPPYWSPEPLPQDKPWRLLRASDAELDALRAAFAVDDPRLFQDGHAGAGWGAAAPVAAWKVENTATWNKYAAERRAVRTDLQVLRDKGCRMPTVRIRKQVWDALRGLRDYDSALNEVPLLHATKRGVLLSVLVGGLNERYNASSRFGHGSYLADDIAKCDQYVDPDHAHPQGDATRRLADELGVAPEGDWKFVLVCRAILGHHASTTQRGTNFDGLWARNAALKELAHVHEGVPISHHSLVVRCPVHETPHVGARFRFSEYVLYHSARVMPDFLVAYRRQ